MATQFYHFSLTRTDGAAAHTRAWIPFKPKAGVKGDAVPNSPPPRPELSQAADPYAEAMTLLDATLSPAERNARPLPCVKRDLADRWRSPETVFSVGDAPASRFRSDSGTISFSRIKAQWMWENPDEARFIIDHLYRKYFQFNPINDVVYHMFTHPDVKAPELSEDPNYRPVIRLAPDGKNFEVAYLDLKNPGAPARTQPSREEWLADATFFEAYLHLFDVDMKDAFDNSHYWKLQKDVTFYLDLISAGLALAPAFTLSAMLYGEAGSAKGVLASAANDSVLNGLLLWLGLTAATKSGPFRDHPIGAAVRGVVAAVALVRKFAENELFVAFKDYLGHDPKNYFHARHLRPVDLAIKYVKVLFPGGIPVPNVTNVELELWKDFPNTFKWYNRVKDLVESTATKARTSGQYTKKLIDLTKSTLTWAPKTEGQWLRTGLHYVTNFAVVAGLGTIAGTDASFAELALVSGAITALSTAMHVYIDEAKKITPALGMLFRRINSFVLSTAAFVSAGAAHYQAMSYTTALAVSFVTILALGGYLKAHEQQVKARVESLLKPKTA